MYIKKFTPKKLMIKLKRYVVRMIKKNKIKYCRKALKWYYGIKWCCALTTVCLWSLLLLIAYEYDMRFFSCLPPVTHSSMPLSGTQTQTGNHIF